MSAAIAFNFLGQKPSLGHPVFFLMGAGFMLVKTKAITELGLLFGNTWHVVGIVIAGILTMAFLANCCVQWLRITQPHIAFVLLLATLAGGWLLAQGGGFAPTVLGRLGAVIVLTGPMFFSGIAFSVLLRGRQDIAAVMAVNLMGAMLGGVLEYNSMYFGFRFLYVLAGVLYLLAALPLLVRRRQA